MGLLKIKTATDLRNDLCKGLKKMALGLAQIKEGKGISHKSAVVKLKELSKKWK